MRRPSGAAVLLIVIVALLYAPTLSSGWVYEDWNDPQRFMALPTWGAFLDRWNRSLTTGSLLLSGAFSPMEPWGYHLVSVALHAVNTGVLFWLGYAMWNETWPAFVCALLFAVHPIQTEAVAYISARPDLLMTTFVLLALLAAEYEHWLWMLVACVCAVLAKESGIVAGPLALWWAVGREKSIPRWLYALSALGLGVGTAAIVARYDLSGFDLTYTAQETAKLWYLLSKVAIPVGLSIDHDYGWFPQGFPMLALMGTIALACWSLVSARMWAFGAAFVLIAIAPRLLTPLLEGLHEHHLYICTIGIFLALVGSFQKGRYGVSETLAQA